MGAGKDRGRTEGRRHQRLSSSLSPGRRGEGLASVQAKVDSELEICLVDYNFEMRLCCFA
ncbi:hypothetical protein E2562_000185 [Oryza meyeriana var. granulata]|uniref:Uncharacterized protein n=1 Tax=Oryza meyeriana var. granulata TaxID=110450 RepID=A0A6G1DDS6_9ORYZ|nr:hypothetical protein E2562_000185 [Oryza meyeriana var. granulata]